MNALRNTSDTLKNKIGSGVVILASAKDDKVNLIVAATKDAVSSGIHSGRSLRKLLLHAAVGAEAVLIWPRQVARIRKVLKRL